MSIINLPANNDKKITIKEDMMKAREELGLSQRKLGSLTGIGQSNICKIETGKFNPSISMLQRIANALGKDLVIRLE